jgi:hypothetical protein
MPIISLLLGNWKLVLLGLLVAAVGYLNWRLESCKKGAEEYRISVEALGKAQEMETARIIKEREKAAQEAQNALQTRLTDLASKYAAARRQLRDKPGPESVPTLASAAPVLCPGPDAELAGRLADLEGRILALTEAGDRELAKYRQLWEWASKLR